MQKWVVRVVAAVMTLGIIPVSLAMAAPTPAPTPAGSSTTTPGQGLEISPPVVELSANPGQTITTSIRIRNVAAGELIAKGKADDFGADDKEDGKPKFLFDETGATRYSLKYWVQSVPDLRLAPQELKTANITIKVPANAEPGGHFGVVRFTAVPPDVQGTGVALSASVGALVLLRVSGNVTDNLDLVSFTTSQNGQSGSFFEHGPVGFTVRLKDTGSVHEKPQGTIDVTGMFGKKIGSIKVNENGGNVLPDSIRRFDEELGKKSLFGHYTAKLNLTYASGAKKLSGQVSFWVIPWKLILLAIIALVVLVFLIRLGLKRYNAYIIAQARK